MLLVAVSGGPDSLALLLLARATLGNRCIAATVDHGLRPESAGEAQMVGALCADLGIDHAILREPLPDRVSGSANVSSRARKLRYDLLHAHRIARGAAAIATGHHADDQLETIVMRLNRGAGVGGLSGIRRAAAGVVRPVLGWRRAELAGVVAAAGIVPVDDPSNTDDRYDRARLRKALATADWLDPIHAAVSAAALADADAALDWSVSHLLADRLAENAAGLHIAAADVPHEYRRRIAAYCIARLDPAWRGDGAGLEGLLERLAGGGTAMLGNVLAECTETGWFFRLAPPRRSH